MTRNNTPLSRQEMRSIATRGKLVAAAIKVLGEGGYAQFSFVKVCEQAGLSRGAVHHHYITPYDLLADVIAELFGRLTEAVTKNLKRKTEGAPDKDTFVDALWSQLRGDDFRILLELRAAAASDPDLATAITEPNQQINQSTIAHAVAGLSPQIDETTVRVTFAALTGLALQYFTLVHNSQRKADTYARDFIGVLKEGLCA